MTIELCIILILISYVSLGSSAPMTCAENSQLPEVDGTKFYYFSYGSNLLASRLLLQNPSALRVGPALLKNYRLDFEELSQRWAGSPSTIVPTPDDKVYGALWKLDMCDMKNLDEQEGVSSRLYEPKTVSVQLISKTQNETLEVMSRTYLMVNQPITKLNDYKWDEVPEHRQPSKTYLKCLVKGAIETGLPLEYVNWLRSIKHNNCIAPAFEEILELVDFDL